MIKRYVCAVMRGRIYLYMYDTFATKINFTRTDFWCEMHNFTQIVFYFCYILLKNAKKCKKMQKKAKKICVYKKIVVTLHQISKRKSRNTKK